MSNMAEECVHTRPYSIASCPCLSAASFYRAGHKCKVLTSFAATVLSAAVMWLIRICAPGHLARIRVRGGWHALFPPVLEQAIRSRELLTKELC